MTVFFHKNYAGDIIIKPSNCTRGRLVLVTDTQRVSYLLKFKGYDPTSHSSPPTTFFASSTRVKTTHTHTKD